MHSEFTFFGLLYINLNENSAVNLDTKSKSNSISIYLNNAIILSRTLAEKKIQFILLTNNKAYLESISSSSINIAITEIDFTTHVHSGLKFYSAHFKLDAFKYIANLKLGYAVLCDLDIVCINPIPKSFINLALNKTSLVYDITDQVKQAYGENTIINDTEKITKKIGEGRWYGGEFIAGNPKFFLKLSNKISSIYQNYLDSTSSIHHVGDEAYTTAAISLLKLEGERIEDAGTLGIIGRYWSVNTLHYQRSFEYFQNCFLLHLPADKLFLSNYLICNSNEAPFSEKFIIFYKKFVVNKKTKLLKNLLKKLYTLLFL